VGREVEQDLGGERVDARVQRCKLVGDLTELDVGGDPRQRYGDHRPAVLVGGFVPGHTATLLDLAP
jgi:hypothetical protein